MIKIIILPNINLCPKGLLITITTFNLLNKNLCDILLENNINILHACEKFGKCGTCYVIIKEGLCILNKIDFDENETLSKLNNTKLNLRLSCKLFFNSNFNIVIEIPV